jgi:hypothetical protein
VRKTVDYNEPWYHGSPEALEVLRKGSWVTQFKEFAKAFSHKPPLISFGDDECRDVKHNGKLAGRLYVLAESIGPDDVSYLPDTAGTHWQTQRDLNVRLVAELPVDDPPQLSEEEIAELGKRMPEGGSGMICDPD